MNLAPCLASYSLLIATDRTKLMKIFCRLMIRFYFTKDGPLGGTGSQEFFQSPILIYIKLLKNNKSC